MKDIVITRKIQLNFNVADKAELKLKFKKIYEWQRICHKAANWVATHQYIQSEIQSIHYIVNEEKVKLADVHKDEDGILTTSRQNTTYQVLSRAFKGEAPMAMLTALNTVVSGTVKQELQEVRMGKRSLRTYRDTIPMPMPSASFRTWKKSEDGNYTFELFDLSFKTYFGRDLSGNEVILDSALAGEYKLCDSSLQLKKGKIFLLAVFKLPPTPVKLLEGKVCAAELSADYPIIANIGKKTLMIGTAEEYLHRRVQIQRALQRLQAASRYNEGGKGRTKKLAALDRFHEKEKNYVTTKAHQYSSMLVDHCVKHKCAQLVLKKQTAKQEEAKAEFEQGEPFLLRNWGYYGLKEKIAYKCRKFGIELIVE
jgi:IS605 OrfB family transposase